MNKYLALLVLLLSGLLCQTVVGLQRDVCILGGGAGGMSAAVLLKDRGYSVVVLEQADEIGGCCNTLRFDAPAGQSVNWKDIGVIMFQNTTLANSLGYGPWTLNSVEFFSRFAGAQNVVSPGASPASTSYAIDLKRGRNLGVQTPSPPSPEYAAALTRLKGIIAQYPWLDSAQVPSVVPPALLVPFSQFITTNNLQPLKSLFNSLLFSGGLGRFSDLTTLYAMLNMGPSILSLFINAPPFTLKGGCKVLYDGMRNYLGTDNVVVNAAVHRVKRTTGQPAVVKGFALDPSRLSSKKFKYNCGSVVIAFPPTYEKVSAIFDLDYTEREYYQMVKIRPYFAIGVDLKGPAVDNKVVSFGNVDPYTSDNLPVLPATVGISRSLPYGPFTAPALGTSNCDTPMEIKREIEDQLDNLPSSLVTSATISSIYQHEFQPYYSAIKLAHNPSPHAVLRSLQGHRNTYVVGAVDSYASHVQIIERNTHLIAAKFPPKN